MNKLKHTQHVAPVDLEAVHSLYRLNDNDRFDRVCVRGGLGCLCGDPGQCSHPGAGSGRFRNDRRHRDVDRQARGNANQKWVITPKGTTYTPSNRCTPRLWCSRPRKGAQQIGTPIVLETESGKPWQEWTLKKNENGTYCSCPGTLPKKGLDHLGGKPVAGARIDLWTNNPGDQHLEWIIRPLAGSMAAVASGTGESPPGSHVPPEIKPEEIRKGELKNFTFSNSTIFPGTVRQVTVFIPAQYDGSKPACVYVKTDGFNPMEETLLETLIATREMPVTIGVFVTPGDLPAR